MGGTAPICPFCRKLLNLGGLKDHIKAKHPEEYKGWIVLGQPPYWRYHKNGGLIEPPRDSQRGTDGE